MSNTLKQTDRIASLEMQNRSDQLVLTAFEATEGLSELFEIEVHALSTDEDVDFSSDIGAGCSVTVVTKQGGKRIFHGLLAEAEWTGKSTSGHTYRLAIKPWPWFLRHTGNCRIFENMSLKAILEKVFGDQGFSDYSFKAETNPTFEYCVQYRESDLNFALRLMEENGIYYYFEHSSSKHTLVMLDRSSAHKPVPNLAKIPFIPGESAFVHQGERLDFWRKQRRFTTGKSVYNDYDFEKPKTAMKQDKQGALPFTHGKLEFYEYPGRYTKTSDGDRMVNVRQQSFEAVDKRRFGSGAAPSLTPGYKVTLEKHPTSGENAEYLVVRCRHSVAAQEYHGGAGSGAQDYTGSFEFLPATVQFRAPMATEKPRIHGTQTARVVGQSGEEIDTDKYGRIKVEFHWDRDDTQSRWVRVAQVWAGNGWGGVFIPRIGMEVVVAFEEGDPDHPLVIGTVYNADNMPPYSLPGKKNISGLKSESTKSGDGYNEFIFDDTKNSEKIGMHAEKDLEVTVDNTETRVIKGEKLSSGKGVFARKTTIEKGDEVLEISQGHQDEKIKMGNRTCVIDMGNDELTLKMGNRTTKLNLGKDETEAMQSIELKVGQSSIKLDQMGITIKAMMIKIDAQIQLQTHGLMVQQNADAIHIVKGGLVLIN